MEWCGHPLRRCVSCGVTDKTIELWDACAARIMSPRLALRIRRLATLAKNEAKRKYFHNSMP